MSQKSNSGVAILIAAGTDEVGGLSTERCRFSRRHLDCRQ